jgi:DNA-binding IclR family transcriptional regulator
MTTRCPDPNAFQAKEGGGRISAMTIDTPAGDTPAKPGTERRAPLRRAMRVIRWMVESGRASSGVREVARALDTAPSTTHQILSMMEDAAIVERDPEGRTYSFTLEFVRIASLLAQARYPLYKAALPRCRQLRERTGEAVYFGLYDAGRREFMYVEYFEAASPINYVMPRFEWIPLRLGGAGSMAIMPFLTEREQHELVGEMTAGTSERAAQRGRKQLERELATVRENGYVVSVGRRIPGAAGIAAPVFGASNEILGNLVLALPAERLAQHDPDDLGRAVSAAARAASSDLGGGVPGSRNRERRIVP